MVVAIIIYALLFIIAIAASFMVPYDTATCLSLIVAFFTLIATIGIAVLIYSLQRKDEIKKTEIKKLTVKAVMAAELESAFDSLILMPNEYSCSFVGGGTKDLFLANAVELQEILSPELFRHLSSVVQFVDSFDREDDNYEGYSLLLRDWVVSLFSSKYKEYYPLVLDFHELLNKRTFNLLKELNNSTEEYAENLCSIRCTEGNEIFTYYPAEKRYVVNDGTTKYLDGTLEYVDRIDSVGIYDGFEKSDRFEGQYHNGEPNGYGIRFDRDGSKSDEGIWSESKLTKGTEYNIICKDNGEEPDDVIESYRDFMDFRFGYYSEIRENGIDKYNVYDRIVDGDKVVEWKNKRSFESFLNERNPRLLKWYKAAE